MTTVGELKRVLDKCTDDSQIVCAIPGGGAATIEHATFSFGTSGSTPRHLTLFLRECTEEEIRAAADSLSEVGQAIEVEEQNPCCRENK
jgi:hypothetical protein